MLPLQGAQIQSRVKELRPHMLGGAAISQSVNKLKMVKMANFMWTLLQFILKLKKNPTVPLQTYRNGKK